MQLFGLVNTLLSTDRDTSRKDLAIQRYSVVPLSPNSGLISWVAQCDTLHALIKEYREQRRTLLNIEHRLMLQMAADYDLLPVLQASTISPPHLPYISPISPLYLPYMSSAC